MKQPGWNDLHHAIVSAWLRPPSPTAWSNQMYSIGPYWVSSSLSWAFFISGFVPPPLPPLPSTAPGQVQSPSEKYSASLMPCLSQDFLNSASTSRPSGDFVTLRSVVFVSQRQKPSWCLVRNRM